MLIFIEIVTLCGSSILFIVKQHKYYTSHLLFRTFQVISRSTPCLVIVLAWEILWSKRCLFFRLHLGFLFRSEGWELEGSMLCAYFICLPYLLASRKLTKIMLEIAWRQRASDPYHNCRYCFQICLLTNNLISSLSPYQTNTPEISLCTWKCSFRVDKQILPGNLMAKLEVSTVGKRM